MKIRIRPGYWCHLSGDRFVGPGEVVEVPDGEGRVHCEEGLADPVVEDKTENAKLDDTSEKRAAGRRRKTEQE